MQITRWMTMAALPLAFGALLVSAQAQGKGKGNERDADRGKAKPAQARSQAPDRARGRDRDQQPQARGAEQRADAPGARAERGNRAPDQDRGAGRGARAGDDYRGEAGGRALGRVDRGRGRVTRTIVVTDLTPAVRVYATSNRAAERLLGRAVGIGALRGLTDDELRIERAGDRVHVTNRRGVVLLDVDDDRARDMGSWRVVTTRFEEREGAPSFCRSGAGHPVWGRQWCLDKGFGLGMDDDIRWGRATDVGDIILRPRTETDLRREILAQVLGDIVFDRLAAHAITLGLTEPLTGRWIGETAGPRVLLLTSGDEPVAEVVDLNRDGRADMLLVALRTW